MTISSLERALNIIRDGRMVILVDDPDFENESSLMMAAEKITPEAVAFMATQARGLVCLPMAGKMIDALGLPLMVKKNTSHWKTDFTISIEARHGVTTGISAADRAQTIQTAVADGASPSDVVRPGHVFPLRARKGGVMFRAGATEGAVDLARLAGFKPAAVICKIMDEDGNMARGAALEKFSRTHGIEVVTISELIAYRMRTESFVHRMVEAMLPTHYGGTFKVIVYTNDIDSFQHIALVKEPIDPDKPTLVRVHSECFTGDLLGSLRCDCGPQMQRAMEMMQKAGSGVLLYIRQEGRGIGLINKLKAYNLQDQGLDTVEANEQLGFKADLRDYGIGAQVLVDLGVQKMRLITNNPKKIVGLTGYGLEVTEQVPIEIEPNEYNRYYLECKKLKMGHMIHLDEEC
ncbi:MAG: bifunctional 3,4-dihydroxy-2-butanone-4-phosphate synthase/GTP cyclohydrolase II [Deltaproteobacteria bacterium]|nr:MAG: bifunctional 3,4-dihydroxy-2-butanone-4-phosphate synthase/GTP cyclohydrolase II [Deltaproteobacteria bacterium]